MATFFRPLCILPLLFATSYAHFLFAPWNFKWLSQKKILGPHELFGNPFGNPDDYKYQHIPNDFDIPRDLFNALNPGNFFNGQGNGNVGANQGSGNSGAGDQGSGNAGANQGSGNAGAGNQGSGNAGGNQGSGNAGSIGQAARKFRGKWELVSKNSGVSAMHAILLPKVNKVLMYDATIWKISNIQLPAGQCRVLNETTKEIDCYAHSILFDIETSELKPLQLHTDTWCSSGGLTLDGNFVSTGGFQKGANTVRYLETCQDCNWREYPNALAAPRWYSTQVELPDGSFIVVGGRDAFSYEYIPPEGKTNAKPFYFDFLRQTSMKEENNLYPFVHLSTDGNVFIFANDRAVLLNPRSNRIVRAYPQLPGGHRSYPASGMSVLLPITLTSRNPKNIPAEVLICGGSGHEDAYSKAEKQIFYNALRDCGRIKITEKNPVWEREVMPSPRIMGDMLILPNGQVIALNGAVRGASGWGFAREPNFVPVLYTPTANAGKRFRKLAASNIARMYHSSSVLLPDGKVLVGGSNTNNGYIYNAMFPTELRIEKFSPPYLDPAQAGNRPEIVLDQSDNKLAYGKDFKLQIRLQVDNIDKNDIKVTMYAPAFTTHGISMNQRLLILNLEDVRTNGGYHEMLAVAPPSGAIAPQGYYMLFVVYKGIPSVSSWVQIK